jgi:hypothetical protein
MADNRTTMFVALYKINPVSYGRPLFDLCDNSSARSHFMTNVGLLLSEAS